MRSSLFANFSAEPATVDLGGTGWVDLDQVAVPSLLLPGRSTRILVTDQNLLFADDFESGNTSSWSIVVLDLAGQFNVLLMGRGIGGDYVACSYSSVSGNFTYLGQTFNETDGGLGGGPIMTLVDLYSKNEHLASSVEPFSSDDPDMDGTASQDDADCFDVAVQ